MATMDFTVNYTGTGNVETIEDIIEVGSLTFDPNPIPPPEYSNCTCDSCVPYNRELKLGYETQLAKANYMELEKRYVTSDAAPKQQTLGLVRTIDDFCVSRKCRAKQPVHLKHNITKTDVEVMDLKDYRALYAAGNFNAHVKNQTCANCRTTLIPTDVDNDFCNDCLASEFGHPMMSNLYDYFSQRDIDAMRDIIRFPEGQFYSFDCRCELCDNWRIRMGSSRANPDEDYSFIDHENWYGMSAECRDCGQDVSYPVHNVKEN